MGWREVVEFKVPYMRIVADDCDSTGWDLISCLPRAPQNRFCESFEKTYRDVEAGRAPLPIALAVWSESLTLDGLLVWGQATSQAGPVQACLLWTRKDDPVVTLALLSRLSYRLLDIVEEI